jgi:hypothetical protein
VHEGRKDHTCKTCGRAFSQLASLRRHCAALHSQEPKLQCELCTTFSSHVKAELERHHKRVHEKQRRHECKYSGCSFTSFEAADVVKHTYGVHLGARSKCPHCPVWLAWKGDLNRHFEEVHLKQKRRKLNSGSGASRKKMSEV